MKRDPPPPAIYGAAIEVLDSLDIMGGDISYVRCTSIHRIELISEASPVKGPDAKANALGSYLDGALTPVFGGDKESLTPLASGGASYSLGLNTAQLNVVWTASQRDTASNPRWAGSLNASSVSDTSLSDLSPVQRSGTWDIRRRKNREWMRKARQRQRVELNAMRVTVARLEKQYAGLSLQSPTALTSDSTGSGALVSRVASEYTQAVELARRLGAENLYLKAQIQQQAAWKLNLSCVLQSCPHLDGPRWAQQFQQFQQPSLGGEEVLRMELDTLDAFEAQDEFGFHALTDLDVTRAILENSRTIAHVPRPEHRRDDAANVGERHAARGVQEGEGRDLPPPSAAAGEPERVRRRARRAEDIATFRSVYVRYLIETTGGLVHCAASAAGVDASAPSTPPQSVLHCSLQASGFVLGPPLTPRAHATFSRTSFASEVSLSIEFLNVLDPLTGEQFQQLRWSGRTDYCGPQHAQRNASDMMQGLLRWELLVISPALNLASLASG
ncbi:unnamed protein product [Phytophthora fragariaefolia]|uniref:Unnamed protein product n=1 Tax=Phytophthora fragariaefolia TaxID=1490495 RepID=A0A9W7D1L3_9STRA|nr:unnamed protein product [Phytophthora fragariaefolia]